ncbi:MAG: large subunit ribosomal protein L21 [Candidatus Deianiraeaceae bacterium]|jgi:large subunit ribosomal protein L21
MFAVIKVGGKQFKVINDQELDIDLVNQDEGSIIEINEVLLLSDDTINIHPEGSIVKCEIIKHFRAPKVIVFKNRQRSTFRKKRGHRQDYTRVKIKEIVVN